MLNPKANEFKPGQFGLPSTETPKPKPQLEEEKSLQQQQQQQQRQQQQQLHSKKRPPKSNKPQQQHQQKQQKSHGKSDRRSSSDHHQPKKSNRSKNQQVTNGSGSGVGSGRRQKGGSSSSTHPQQQQQASSSSTAQQTDNDSFGLLTKFITIEEAIDPVFRTRPTEDKSKNLDGSSGSTGEAIGKLIHGYERYIEWISRCLRAFETITVVGMDYAIADVVSLVTILQRRNIGEHEEVETFSLDQGNKRYTSGIQVKVHLCT